MNYNDTPNPIVPRAWQSPGALLMSKRVRKDRMTVHSQTREGGVGLRNARDMRQQNLAGRY